MSGIAKLKSYFFLVTNVLRPNGTQGGVRFRDTDMPNQQTFEDLLASTAFKKETGEVKNSPYAAA